jgi:hypothetical protein
MRRNRATAAYLRLAWCARIFFHLRMTTTNVLEDPCLHVRQCRRLATVERERRHDQRTSGWLHLNPYLHHLAIQIVSAYERAPTIRAVAMRPGPDLLRLQIRDERHEPREFFGNIAEVSASPTLPLEFRVRTPKHVRMVHLQRTPPKCELKLNPVIHEASNIVAPS